MPEVIRGRNKPMECLFERSLIGMGFVVVHDGSKDATDIDWLKHPDHPTMFTRTLRAKVDGEFVNTWVKFTYDLRSGFADFTVSHHDLVAFENALATPHPKTPWYRRLRELVLRRAA